MKNNYLFNTIVLLLLCCFGIEASAQNNYTVSAIPHQAYASLLPLATTSDDSYSGAIPLGFDFTFFGNTYNYVNVSTNGYLDFSTTQAGLLGSSPWSLTQQIPNAGFPVKNAILGCYHDLFNGNAQGTISAGIVGTAPFRKFVLIYNNNAQFQCATTTSSFQIIIYETLNVIDSQIIHRGVCSTWNGGNAVIGILDSTGLNGFTPPGRNTGQWTAANEGWRFTPVVAANAYNYSICDADNDGFETFNLSLAQNAIDPVNPSNVKFYLSEADALQQMNALPFTNFTNTAIGAQTIYTVVNDTVKSIALKTINCGIDYDEDTVSTVSEDLNANGNLADDDTDGDGIPNFIDNDDDGDLILTNAEYVFTKNASAILDTDNDGIPNYLDNDDDGDGILTVNEDYNGNNNPLDDDTNADGIPDYLQSNVALGTNGFNIAKDSIMIFPSPASDFLNIDNKRNETITSVSIYSINGVLVKDSTKAMDKIQVSDLQTGVYFVKIRAGNQTLNYKFIKK